VEVVSGSRGVQTAVPVTTAIPRVSLREAGEAGAKVYISRAANLLVSIKMVPPRFDAEGNKEHFASVKAQFKRNRFETKDALTQSKLEACKGFRLGGDFWLLEDEKKAAAVAAVTNFEAALKSIDLSQIPSELLAKLQGGLGATVKPDFDAKA
jgi:hypothetical protein